MNPRAQTLFHFTRSAAALEGILRHGLLPRYCLEDVGWLGSSTIDFVAFPMICFCDIPLSRIQQHSAFYGDYGIGLTKEWGLTNGLAPVMYAPPDSGTIELLRYLLAQWKKCPKSQSKRKAEITGHVFRLWSSIKPLGGKMIVAGAPVEKEFYQENEWRFVPKHNALIKRENYAANKEKANKDVEKFALAFKPSDIRYLIVKSETEVPSLVDFILTQMGTHPHNDLKLLQTRIFTLDTLAVDM